MLRPRPRPSSRGWRRREAGAEPAGPGRWLRLLLPPLLPSPHPPQLQPAGSPVQPRCPGARARPRPGFPAHRVFSLRASRARHRQRRAPTQLWATLCTGPCQVRRRAPPGRRALGFFSPRGTLWVTSGEPPHLPLEPSAGAAGWNLRCFPTPGSARAERLSFALWEGGYRVLVTLGTPVLFLPALARCAKGPLGRCCATPCLCSSPRALMKEPGALQGGEWNQAPQGFRRPKAARCAETAAAESWGGGCSQGYLSYQPLSAPAVHAALVWPRSHAHPGCAPLWCLLSWELSSPLQSPLTSASPPS